MSTFAVASSRGVVIAAVKFPFCLFHLRSIGEIRHLDNFVLVSPLLMHQPGNAQACSKDTTLKINI